MKKNVSWKNWNFLSFWVNVSKYNDLKSAVESLVVDNLGVYLIFILKTVQLCFLIVDSDFAQHLRKSKEERA